jgi:hypothetical protein
MNYTVVWLPDAERELAAVWVASSRQADVTTAAVELDRRLAQSGPNVGESRSDNNRITFEPPLAILFRVDLAARTVYVVRVWEY